MRFSILKNDFFQSLRRIHGNLYEWRLDKKKRLSILWNVMFHKVIIVGTPEHGNLGDNAIVIAMYEFLCYCGIKQDKVFEITYSEYELIEKDLSWIPKMGKLVLGVGGGNFGDLWYNEQQLRESFTLAFSRCSIIIFPQSILFDSESKLNHSIEVFSKVKKLSLCARDEQSFRMMNQWYSSCCEHILSVPDIVLFLKAESFDLTASLRSDVLLCMRQDKEKKIDGDTIDTLSRMLSSLQIEYRYTDTVIEDRTTPETRIAFVKEKIREFLQAKLIVTDRLHGMVFAAITGTPCIVFGNNHHKVRGTYEWISYLPYIRFCESVPSKEEVEELLSMGDQQYSNSPLMSAFDRLKELVLSEL